MQCHVYQFPRAALTNDHNGYKQEKFMSHCSEARSPKWGCRLVHVPAETSGTSPTVSDGCQQFGGFLGLCSLNHLISVSIFTWPTSLHVCVFEFPSHFSYKVLIQYDSSSYICKDAVSKYNPLVSLLMGISFCRSLFNLLHCARSCTSLYVVPHIPFCFSIFSLLLMTPHKIHPIMLRSPLLPYANVLLCRVYS